MFIIHYITQGAIILRIRDSLSVNSTCSFYSLNVPCGYETTGAENRVRMRGNMIYVGAMLTRIVVLSGRFALE